MSPWTTPSAPRERAARYRGLLSVEWGLECEVSMVSVEAARLRRLEAPPLRSYKPRTLSQGRSGRAGVRDVPIGEVVQSPKKGGWARLRIRPTSRGAGRQVPARC